VAIYLKSTGVNMINEQVKSYFKNCRFQRACEIFRENNYIDVELEGLYLVIEGVGTGVKIPITKDDLNFVHQVQYKYKKAGHPSDSMPINWKILAAKYALLHPEPLHDYVAKWDVSANGEKLKIFERRRVGSSSRTKDHPVAVVGPQLYVFYAKANNKKVNPKTGEIDGMPFSKENDEIVAKWWINENKDCLHNYGEEAEGEAPSPQVKILRRGTNSADLAFMKKKLGANWKYQWYPVREIHVNMNSFRKKAEDSGFNQLLHAGHILRTTPKKWQAILEPEKIRTGGKLESNPTLKQANKAGLGIPHPKLKDTEIRPRNLKPSEIEKMPDEYKSRLSVSKAFTISDIRKLIDTGSAQYELDDEGSGDVTFNGVKIGKILAPSFLTPGHREAETDSSDEFNRQYSTNKEFQRVIDNSIKTAVRSYLGRRGSSTDDDNLFKDITQSTFLRFSGRTSRIPDEDWKNWRELLGDPENWRCGQRHIENNTSFGNRLCSLIGSSAQTEVKHALGLDKAGGPKSVVATGTYAKDKEDMPYGDERSTVDNQQMGSDIDSLNTPQAVLSYLQSDMTSIRDPRIQAKIRQFASSDPTLARIAQGLDHLNAQAPAAPQQTDDDDDFANYGDDDDDLGASRYGKASSRYESYSFRKYFNKRINEMGVVWGNDKGSAKKLKPHQTLKGGIQVQGAPWTAAKGINNPDNDIKIKG
jgi:hypothetical protein